MASCNIQVEIFKSFLSGIFLRFAVDMESCK